MSGTRSIVRLKGLDEGVGMPTGMPKPSQHDGRTLRAITLDVIEAVYANQAADRRTDEQPSLIILRAVVNYANRGLRGKVFESALVGAINRGDLRLANPLQGPLEAMHVHPPYRAVHVAFEHPSAVGDILAALEELGWREGYVEFLDGRVGRPLNVYTRLEEIQRAFWTRQHELARLEGAEKADLWIGNPTQGRVVGVSVKLTEGLVTPVPGLRIAMHSAGNSGQSPYFSESTHLWHIPVPAGFMDDFNTAWNLLEALTSPAKMQELDTNNEKLTGELKNIYRKVLSNPGHDIGQVLRATPMDEFWWRVRRTSKSTLLSSEERARDRSHYQTAARPEPGEPAVSAPRDPVTEPRPKPPADSTDQGTTPQRIEDGAASPQASNDAQPQRDAASLEADVAAYRRLTQENPAAYRAELAESLTRLGDMYGRNRSFARDQRALAPVEEAVEIWRNLCTDDSQHLAALASSLTLLGRLHQRLGQTDPATAALEEAVEIWRDLSVTESKYAPRLGRSLELLSDSYPGRPENRELALSAAEEAVQIWRGLVAEDSSYRPNLAASLVFHLARRHGRMREGTHPRPFPRTNAEKNERDRYLELRERDVNQSICTIQEAVDIWRELSKEDGRFKLELARSLDELRDRAHQAGGPSSGADKGLVLSAAQEAVDVWRDVASVDRERPSGLASAQRRLSQEYRAAGYDRRALSTQEESIESWRRAVETNDRHLFALANALYSFGSRCIGHPYLESQGMASLQESVQILRTLSAAQPTEKLLGIFADQLIRLSDLDAARQHRTEALEAAEEAVRIFRYQENDPHWSTNELVRRLAVLARRHEESGSTDKGIEIREGIAGAYRQWPSPAPSDMDMHWPTDQLRLLIDRPRFFRDLGKRYSQVGRNEESVSVTREAVDFYNYFPDYLRERYKWDRVLMIQALSNRYGEAGDTLRAVAASMQVEKFCQEGGYLEGISATVWSTPAPSWMWEKRLGGVIAS